MIGTIPGAIVGFFFEHFIEETWRNPGPIAAAMIGVAVLMLVVEAAGGLRRGLKEVNLGDSLIVGCAQALALFPGRVALGDYHHRWIVAQNDAGGGGASFPSCCRRR